MPLPAADSAIDLYQSLCPWDFPLFSRFDLRQIQDTNGEQGLLLTVILRPRDLSDTRRLQLTFTGVRTLRFVPEHFFWAIPLGLEIVSIQDRHWETLRYQVFNQEQDVELAFYAEDFNAAIVAVLEA